MFLKIRCPVCGMQVSPSRIKARPIVAVGVTSKGRGGIQNIVIENPPVVVLKRVKDVLKTASGYIGFYDFDKEALPSLIQKSDLSLEPISVCQPVLIERR